jgi:hypothetical protein
VPIEDVLETNYYGKTKEQVAETEQRRTKSQVELSNLLDRQNHLTTRILQSIEEKKERYSRSYLIVSWLTYLLLTFGFALSLTGHPVGKDGELTDLKFLTTMTTFCGSQMPKNLHDSRRP